MHLRCLPMLLLGVLAAFSPAANADTSTLSLLQLSRGEGASASTFRLETLQRGTGQQTSLELSPAAIFTADARLVLNDGKTERSVPPPAVRHYVGREYGRAGSMAFVSVHPDGRIRGWLRAGSVMEAFGSAPGETSPAKIRTVDMTTPEVAGRRFECGSEELPVLLGSSSNAEDQALATALRTLRGQAAATSYTAAIAIDTDVAYLARFDGNVNDAAVYAADLIGVISATYRAEIQTGFLLSYVRLWTGDEDPWTEGSLGCRLRQFGKHWNDNMADEPRALAHLLSGGPGGGIAWLGTLCRVNLNVGAPDSCTTLNGNANYAGHYGVSAGIRGNLDPGNPQVVWDLIVVAHELGHNFNSPHTHCYKNIGNNPEPIDKCHDAESGNNCHAQGVSLPGPQGAASGTIMSYCHTRPGGISNMANSLGTGHPFGDEPGRVPTRMRARVEQVVQQYPGCLISELIFVDGFDSQ